jgi:hypothetical protein
MPNQVRVTANLLFEKQCALPFSPSRVLFQSPTRPQRATNDKRKFQLLHGTFTKPGKKRTKGNSLSSQGGRAKSKRKFQLTNNGKQKEKKKHKRKDATHPSTEVSVQRCLEKQTQHEEVL